MPVTPIGDYIDVNLATKLLLDGQAAVVAAAPGGIFGPPGLPQGWTPSSGTTLVYTTDDSPSQWGTPTIAVRTMIRCYGLGPQACRAASSVVAATLHRASRQTFSYSGRTYLTMYVEKADGPTYTREPDTEWEFDLLIFNVGWVEHTL